ncbi:TPA: TolC family protein [Citrobacter freundii]|nr:TolC family protein [Citrobacter freundii]
MFAYRFLLACLAAAPAGVSFAAPVPAAFSYSDNGGVPVQDRAVKSTARSPQAGTAAAGHEDGTQSPALTRRYLQTLVREGLNYSSEIKSAQAGADASRFEVERVKGERYPQVRLSTGSPLAGKSAGKSRGGVKDTSATLSATTTLYDFGHKKNRILGGEETVRAADEETRLTRDQIAAEIVISVAMVDRFQRALVIAGEYESRMKKLTGMLSEITQTDGGRQSELVQARSRLLQAQTHVHQIETHLDEVLLKLTRLTGKRIALKNRLDWDGLGSIPLESVLQNLDNHPQLMKSQAQIRAGQHEVEAAKSSRLPSVNWTVSRSIDRNNSDDWYTGVNLEWDIFTGGSATASVNAASQRAQAARMEYETSLHELQYRIRDLARSREASVRKTGEYDALAQETGRIRDMFYEQWFSLGTRTLLDVLSAENEHFTAGISRIDNQFEAWSAGISLMSESSGLLKWLDLGGMAADDN